VDSFVLQPGSRASFGIGKLGNEKMAIIVGGLSGVLKVYLIPEDITQIFPEVKDNLMFHNRLQQFYNKDWGARIQPAVGDLNNDGADDVLIGNSRGGLHYVKGIPDSTKYISRMKVEPFLLFPNPNTGQLTILLPTPDASFSYQITDLNGKIIQEGEANNNQTLMLNESLSNGVYFILIQVDNVYYLPQKFVLSR
jgi:hypothetical protein